MNLLHLKYVIEVAKAGSISKAASNLYMNQPHLSKTIKDLEENMQIIIFERTSKGVIPTKKGAEFIERAKSIIMQVEEMEAMYQGYDDKSVHLDICVPRASYVANAFTNYLSMINFHDKNIKVNYRETNSFDTIKDVYEGEANIGIIRFPIDEESYFLHLLETKEIKKKKLYQFNYQLLFSNENPLSFKEIIYLSDLETQIEITHGDTALPSLPIVATNRNDETRHSKKEISVYERASQFELLNHLPHTFMWVSPIPQEVLKRFNLVTKECQENKMSYHDLLITRKGYRLSKEDEGFIRAIKCSIKEINI